MIIAIDPGKMTGGARMSGNHSFWSGEMELQETLHHIYETLKQGEKPVLVCEDFVYTVETLHKTRQTWSSEGIGALRFLAFEFDCEFVIQTPAAAKSFSSNEKLKRIGWYQPGKGHANDAARHLLLYCVGNGLIRVQQFIE